jgi:hypothetical protein
MTLHSNTHDITSRVFWHTIRLKKKSAIYHRFQSHETQYPYRYSNSRVLRLPGSTFGIVLGRWTNVERSEAEAIMGGLSGRVIPLTVEYIEPDIDMLIKESEHY